MAKINHENLKRRELGERAELDALSAAIKPAIKEKKSKWIGLQSGDYSGFTLTSLFPTDLPQYCQIMIEHFLEGPEAGTEIAKQGRDIANRACNLLPPGPYRDTSEFLIIVDRDKIFERFIVVLTGKPLKEKLAKGSRVVARVSTLDFTEPYKHRKPEIGLRRMAECIKQTYGWTKASNPVRKVEVFFEYDKNFNMAAIVPANESQPN